MRLISLEPFVTDVLVQCGVGLDLVGMTHLCEIPKTFGAVPVTTKGGTDGFVYSSDDDRRLAAGLSGLHVDLKQLFVLNPDVIVSDVRADDPVIFISWAEQYIGSTLRHPVRIFNPNISRLGEMYTTVEELGGLLGKSAEARGIANRLKAQLMAWADSFFERCRGKRVAVLSSVNPLHVSERWIADVVRLMGAKYIERKEKDAKGPWTWDEIIVNRPDVIVVAPEGGSLTDSAKTFSILQGLAHWEEIPAVKRGEVIFCSGVDLYRPGPRFLRGAAILVSAIAGLDSGYITGRDDFLKMRYLELHRHKFL